MADDDDTYANIRDPELLGPIKGQRLVEVTQHDAEDFPITGSRIFLHFENGYTLSFPVGDDGFDIGEG